ncbi:hypothetical protein D3C84_804090 [compost metagenome]
MMLTVGDGCYSVHLVIFMDRLEAELILLQDPVAVLIVFVRHGRRLGARLTRQLRKLVQRIVGVLKDIAPRVGFLGPVAQQIIFI